MEKYAWKAIVKEGMLEEYTRRHNEIWPELVELLKAAGFAVAVANAPARVQRCADLVTGSCMEGGVAMFLNALMEEKLGKTGV